MAILRIRRKKNIYDFLRKKYEIVLDNVNIGVISSGETLDIDIKEGKHSLSLKIYSTGGRTVTFLTNVNETKEFLCGSLLGFDDAFNLIFTLGLVASLYKSFLVDLNLYIIPAAVDSDEMIPYTPLIIINAFNLYGLVKSIKKEEMENLQNL